MNIHILDTEPRPETLDDEPGMAEYALRNHDRPDTIVGYMLLPVADAAMWSRLLNSQAYKAWELGFDYARAESYYEDCNPFTTQTQVDGL